MKFEAFSKRLRNDFQLAMITLFGGIVVVALTPFAIFRFANGEFHAGILDLSIEAMISLTMLYAWLTGDSKRAGVALSFVIAIATTVAMYVLGPPGISWIYTALLANFFIVSRKLAMVLAVVMLAALSLILVNTHTSFGNVYPVSVVVTGLIVALFAFTFAYRAELQRGRLEDLASRDALTGAFNRRTLREEFRQANLSSPNPSHPEVTRGVLMLDLDHFKNVNDVWGHEAGDRVLIDFVRIVGAAVRKSDRLFRYGGEEFLLSLVEVDEPALTHIAEHICRQVAAQLRCHEQTVTVSIGGALLRTNEHPEALVARADAALYRAKAAGRNRVVIDSNGNVPSASGAPSAEMPALTAASRTNTQAVTANS